jgi:hypothetical protein
MLDTCMKGTVQYPCSSTGGWLNAAPYECIREIEVVNIVFDEIVFTVFIIVDM